MKNKKTLMVIAIVAATLATSVIAYAGRNGSQNRGKNHHNQKQEQYQENGKRERYNKNGVSLKEVEDRLLKENPGAHIEESKHNRKHGRNYYKIELAENGRECEYKIDADTGEIIEKEGSLDNGMSSEKTSGNTDKINLEQAKNIALKTLADGKILDGKLEKGGDKSVFNIKVEENQKKYNIKISPDNGQVIEKKAVN